MYKTCIFKWLFTIITIIIVMIFAVPLLMAGEYHTNTTLKCAECHTMHYNQTHDYSGAAGSGNMSSTVPQLPLGSGPNRYLLRNSENGLCKSCHDAQTFAPDVVGAHANGYVRESGALNELGGTGNYAEWKGHTLGSTATAPGGTWKSTSGLSCVDCHTVHGSLEYRNLRKDNVSVTYALQNNNSTKDVFLRYGYTGSSPGTLAQRYQVASMDLNEPVSTDSAIGKWCGGCHGNFHGSSNSINMTSGGEWVRHPTADANLDSSALATWKAKTNKVKVMDAGGTWNSSSTNLTPTCITCHKAHGNMNPFGLIYMSGTGTLTEEGDSNGAGISELCMQCHT